MLSHLPAEKHIFVDSNIFIYHFLGLNDSCTRAFVRIENEEITASTSAIVISEVWHRLMIAEATQMFNLNPYKAARYLKNHPESAKRLLRSRQAILCIPKMKVLIWNLTKQAFALAETINQEYGLLTNDALNLALMWKHRIPDIATNDADFERVKNIKIWKPA